MPSYVQFAEEFNRVHFAACVERVRWLLAVWMDIPLILVFS